MKEWLSQTWVEIEGLLGHAFITKRSRGVHIPVKACHKNVCTCVQQMCTHTHMHTYRCPITALLVLNGNEDDLVTVCGHELINTQTPFRVALSTFLCPEWDLQESRWCVWPSGSSG